MMQYILITFSLDYLLKLLEKKIYWCWSLLKLKGLMTHNSQICIVLSEWGLWVFIGHQPFKVWRKGTEVWFTLNWSFSLLTFVRFEKRLPVDMEDAVMAQTTHPQLSSLQEIT